MRRTALICVLGWTLLWMAPVALAGPDPPPLTQRLPEGISLAWGIGGYAVSDDYISGEKYTGTLPVYGLGWTHRHDGYDYRLQVDVAHSASIENYTVRTNIYQFTLNQGFLYPLPRFKILSRTAYPFLGPSTDLFVYVNKPDIAVDGFDYAQSFATLLALGINGHLLVPLAKRLTLDNGLRLGVVALGVRMVDMEETDESMVKALALPSMVHGDYTMGLRYHLSGAASLAAGYRFDLTRIQTWEPLHAGADRFFATLHVWR